MSNVTNEVIKKNRIILDQFKNHLKKNGLSTKTIKTHMDNLDFFCTYLSYYEYSNKSLDEADIGDISDFLSDFFPRKAMWASLAHIKSNIATFKKFFKFSLANNYIKLDDYNDLLGLIDVEKDMWIAAAE